VNDESPSSGRRSVDIEVIVNGSEFRGLIESRLTLAELLRERLSLTGTKLGCNRAECGVCTVLLDGVSVFACTVLAVEANRRHVDTVEGLLKGKSLHPLQEAFVRDDALQCGFCTPGLLMSLKALTDKVENPSIADVKEAISGNYCRCGAYPNIFKAAIEASQVLASQRSVAPISR